MRVKRIKTNLISFKDVRVRFSETDNLGIVWHGNYVKYFEDGREAFGREHNISYLDQKKNRIATPIIKLICDYKLPLHFGEIAKIETTYINTPAVKMIFQYKIINSEGKLVCQGETVQVFVDFNGNLHLKPPPFFEAWKFKKGLL